MALRAMCYFGSETGLNTGLDTGLDTKSSTFFGVIFEKSIVKQTLKLAALISLQT